MKSGSDPRFEAAQDLAGLDLAELTRKALSAVRRHLWFVLACGLVFAALGAALAVLRAPYYTARASIIIDPRVDEGMGSVEVPTIRRRRAGGRFRGRGAQVRADPAAGGQSAGSRGASQGPDSRRGNKIPSDEALRQIVVEDLARSLDIEREGTTTSFASWRHRRSPPRPQTSRMRSRRSTSRRRPRTGPHNRTRRVVGCGIR